MAVGRSWAAQAPQQGAGWVPPEVAAAAAEHAELHGSWTCTMCTLVNSPTAAACEACTATRPPPRTRPAASRGGVSTGRSNSVSSSAPVGQSSTGSSLQSGLGKDGGRGGPMTSPAAAAAPADDDRAADVQLAQEALLRDARAAAESETSGVKCSNGKQKKLPKFEKLRLTGGDASATHDWLETSGGTQKRNPQNAWGATSRPTTARSAASKKEPALPAAWGSSNNSVSQRDRLISEAWSKP